VQKPELPFSVEQILGDRDSSITLTDVLGSDLKVVNAARVSFDSSSEALTLRDTHLLDYLIAHDHWSPFRGVVFTFKVSCPLAIARQWYKHTIASSFLDVQNQWNEVSMRYTPQQDSFYCPVRFRRQASDNKQGSEGFISAEIQGEARDAYLNALSILHQTYDYLLEIGVAKEQARFILPMATYTSFIWTVSLQALLHFIYLRNNKDAQKEIQEYAYSLRDLTFPFVPETYKAFERNR
jgi:thymidylate synthase (FAD)